MKAAILERYDKNGCECKVRDIPVPDVSDGEVLVKIHTAGVNPLDNMIIHGEVKLIVPYQFPLIMGNEFAGVIEKTGSSVTGFSVGDRVYGRMPLGKIGAFAEYAAIDYRAVAKIPEYLTDEEAACIPLTALTALQAFELMQPTPGETIFISGGTGSLGAMAIPVAKGLGMKVITNGSAANEERVTRLGADRFIDYRKEDYSKVLSEVDYVLDTLGEKELEKEFSILKRGGKLVSLRGLPNREFAARTGMSAFKRMLFGFAGKKYDKMAAAKDQGYYFVFVHEDGAGLSRLPELFGDKRIEASVDEIYTLEEVNKALEKVASGGSKGKTILRIS